MPRLTLAVVVLLALIAAETQAAHGFGGFGGFGGRPWGGFGWGQTTPGQSFGFSFNPQNLQDRMPYFALFPPVYYSNPVPRPYGYSPFAYPGFVPTPDPVPQPVILSNPFMNEPSPAEQPNSSGGTKPTPTPAPLIRSSHDKTSAVQPLRLLNPHFNDGQYATER